MSPLHQVIGRIFASAKRNGWDKRELARRADLRPETLSRLVKAKDADFATVARLADCVGLRIVAAQKQREPAAEKATARRKDARSLADGAIAADALQARNGFITLPTSRFDIDDLSPRWR